MSHENDIYNDKNVVEKLYEKDIYNKGNLLKTCLWCTDPTDFFQQFYIGKMKIVDF